MIFSNIYVTVVHSVNRRLEISTMNSLLAAVIALPQGAHAVFTIPSVRTKALIPFLLALFFTFVFGGSVAYYFGMLVDALGFNTASLGVVVGSVSQFFLGLALVFIVPILSLLIVVVITAYYQVEIARDVLRHGGVEIAVTDRSIVAEIVSTSIHELRKLLVVFPIVVFAFLLNFIPILAPVAALLGGWIIGFQFMDIALEARGATGGERMSLTRSAWLSTAVFGMTIALLAVFPFGLILLSPIATAAAAKFSLAIRK